MPSYPKNYPFYNWVPKPVGIVLPPDTYGRWHLFGKQY